MKNRIKSIFCSFINYFRCVKNKKKIYKEIDNILAWYYGQYNPEIYKGIKPKTFTESFDKEAMDTLLGVNESVNSAKQKLKDDGFINSVGDSEKITFEGIILYLDGGYSQQYKDKNKDFWRGVKVAGIAGALGAAISILGTAYIEVWKESHQKPILLETVHPIQVHLMNCPQNQDTLNKPNP